MGEVLLELLWVVNFCPKNYGWCLKDFKRDVISLAPDCPAKGGSEWATLKAEQLRQG